MLGSDGADGGRGLGIATDGDVKVCATRLRPHPHVGRDRVEVKHSSAIDRDGDFWTNVGGERRRCNRVAQVRGDGAGIGGFSGIQAREWIAQDRWTLAKCQVDAGDRCRELLYGVFRQSADLNASARSDLDDAVAVPARGRAQGRERLARHRCASRREPHEQAVSGSHGLRETGASAAAEGAFTAPPLS